jgi:hypothetical protein
MITTVLQPQRCHSLSFRVQAVASSVVRSPPAPDAKAKSIPPEHLADPSLALISAKTSFSNLCEKYRRQTDEVAKEKGARHKRLTRRKGRRAEVRFAGVERIMAKKADDSPPATETHAETESSTVGRFPGDGLAS